MAFGSSTHIWALVFRKEWGKVGGWGRPGAGPSAVLGAGTLRAFPSVQPAESSEQTCGRAPAVPMFENGNPERLNQPPEVTQLVDGRAPNRQAVTVRAQAFQLRRRPPSLGRMDVARCRPRDEFVTASAQAVRSGAVIHAGPERCASGPQSGPRSAHTPSQPELVPDVSRPRLSLGGTVVRKGAVGGAPGEAWRGAVQAVALSLSCWCSGVTQDGAHGEGASREGVTLMTTGVSSHPDCTGGVCTDTPSFAHAALVGQPC